LTRRETELYQWLYQLRVLTWHYLQVGLGFFLA
jgi:hypothetical protein